MKRISMKQFIEVIRPRTKGVFLNPLFASAYAKDWEYGATFYIYMKWWFYILVFIPLHICKLFCVLWDGGLRDFSIVSRMVDVLEIYDDGVRWKRWKKIAQ